MENAFFLPVGRQIVVDTHDQQTYSGELLGVINFGGIPSIWLRRYENEAKTTTFESIVPIINICGLTIEKTNAEKDGLIKL